MHTDRERGENKIKELKKRVIFKMAFARGKTLLFISLTIFSERLNYFAIDPKAFLF